MLIKAQSVERKMADIFGQADAIDLTEEVISDLVRSGWSKVDLERSKTEGARYSPGRNSLIFPVMDESDFID
jgi:hypothetical protein